MVTGSLSRRYARAFIQVGEAQGSLEAMGKELASLAKAFQVSKELGEALSNPAFPRSDRRKILNAILAKVAASPATKTFVMLLLDKERVPSLPAISREVEAMIAQKSGRVTAEVVSAIPLAGAQLETLRTELEQLSGKKVDIQSKEDPALLGGVVAKVGDTVYDGSLRTQLRALRDSMVS
jgi:F-type H+-transporting ATPase subunit delta